ncbi:MAG: hypothetical protein FD176_299 [Rhodospirillaceae bacterium]|nr:MAG: hypothetical protein FD176_299 [Rhodospirillaceae bacterium]TNC97452.1 MAG: hypothetical protein FD119_1052 [Stygiobacter sp.]
MRNVPYVDLQRQFAAERDEMMPVIEAALARADYVGGAAVEKLESELAAFLGVEHVVALASGTDALIFGLRALGIGPGDEVITPPNSFVASTAAIVAVGATPVFADVLPDQNMSPKAVAAAITARTKAIMPVHLTGRMARMDEIMDLAERHGLVVIEDAAQSIGSRYDGRLSGSIGHVGAFSAHPLKNLNAAGDAGFLTTADGDIAGKVRLYRNHGLVDRNTVECWGTVSRLDTLQAEILRLRLARLPWVIERRRANAALYRRLLADAPVFMPPCGDTEFNTFHTFVIQVDQRDALQAFLGERGIGTAIHYPVPIHLQPAALTLGHGPGAFPVCESQAPRILTLPVHQYLEPDDIAYVAEQVRAFRP